ncbi:MAG: hypothetical protein ABSD10_00350 [Candidatus Saccharimonadales bacterium]|jgi:hypothetical protein
MKGMGRWLVLLRGMAVIGAVGVITTGASFAALQSQNASLTGNIINSGTADLRISKDGTTFYSPSTTGYTFDGVVPGGAAAPVGGNLFYLKNYGSANLAIKVGINAAPSNVNNVDLSKVYFQFTRVDSSGSPVSLSLKSLVDSYAAGGTPLSDTVNAGSTATYSVKASMDMDAFAGSSASLTGINLSFIGTGA